MLSTGKRFVELSWGGGGQVFIEPSSGNVHPSNPYLTVWQGDLRRGLQAPVRAGVVSNPIAFVCARLSNSTVHLSQKGRAQSKVEYMTVWPSGLRRWLKAPVRKGVGSNPTAVIPSPDDYLSRGGLSMAAVAAKRGVKARSP